MTDLVSTSPEGDTLDAIRARHVLAVNAAGYTRLECADEGQMWPCDTAVVLAALDDFQRQCIGQGEAVIAAEQREARLRAALEMIANADRNPAMDAIVVTPRNIACAALAPVGSEGTDA